MIHTVKDFGEVYEAEIDVFWAFPCFLYDPLDVDNLISWPLPFLNPAWTSGISLFTYCWGLAWRILSITLLASEMMSPFTKLFQFTWCHPLPNLSKQILGGEQFVFSSLPLLILPMSTSQSHLLFSNGALAILIWTLFISHLDIWGNAQTDLHIFVMWPYIQFILLTAEDHRNPYTWSSVT